MAKMLHILKCKHCNYDVEIQYSEGVRKTLTEQCVLVHQRMHSKHEVLIEERK